jgi:hypothetical protein
MNWGRENFSNFYRQLSASKPVILIAIISLFLIPAVASASGENMTEPEYDTDEEVYMVSTLTELNWIRNAPKEDYKLVDDINATPTKNWNNGKGWNPIGEENYEFYGTLNGDGYKISSLTIDRPNEELVGFIAITGSDAVIKNLKVRALSATGYNYIGGLVGENNGDILNLDYEATVTLSDYINYAGGLVGSDRGGSFEEIHANVTINQNDQDKDETVGGLVGDLDGDIVNSSAIGTINLSKSQLGGLVGSLDGTIRNSNSSVNVKGESEIGGLVGRNGYGKIISSYSTGNVTGDEEVGGLVGLNDEDHVGIKNSYSTSKVTGNRSIGGLVGYNNGKITDSYSIGNVTGDTYEGGLVGWNVGTVESSFWNTQTSGLSESDGGLGKNASVMKDFWSYRTSTDIGPSEGYRDIEIKHNGTLNVVLNERNTTFRVFELNETEEKATIEVNGTNETYSIDDEFTVSDTRIGLNDVRNYEENTYCYASDCINKTVLRFYLDPSWDLKNISSYDNVNQSYSWNIVDGRSYPFLSWEEVEEGNYSTTIEVKNKSGEPIENASVNIDEINKETGPNGMAYFESLYNTQYVASVYADDYREKLINFELSNKDQTETVELQEYNSTFNFSISSINYTDKGDYWNVDSNVTVQNIGDEPGKRRLIVAIDTAEEKNVSLDSGESQNVSFETNVFSEGSYEYQLFRYNQPDSGILVANKTFEVKEEDDDTKEYQLSIKDANGGSIAGSPRYGNTSYDKGEYVYLLARPYEAWDFESWTGDIRRDSKGIYVHMDQDLEVKPNFSRSVAIDFQTYIFPSVAKEEGESIAFNFTINNTREENITEELNVKLGDRKIRNLSKSIEVNSTGLYTSDNSSKAFEFNITKGDAAKVKDLSIEYGGAMSTKSYRIGAIERKFVDGFNYFSIPAVTDDRFSLDDVFTNNELRDVDTSISDKIESIWTYREGEWKNYHPSAPSNDFNTLEAGQGYIVDAKENFTVYPAVDTNLSRVDSDSLVLPAENDISRGWNLIGSYWTDPKYSNQTGAFNSMPEDHITEVLYSDRNGEIGLKKLRGGDIKSGRAYWISAKGNASYTKSR